MLQLSDPAVAAGEGCEYSPPSTLPRQKLAETPAEARKVVYHTVTKGEGKNHQGCLPVSSGTEDEDVQFLRIQRFVVSHTVYHGCRQRFLQIPR